MPQQARTKGRDARKRGKGVIWHGRARPLRWFLGLALAGVFAITSLPAQNTVRWSTNYYTVTGSHPREIRRSISQARPWKQRDGFDALTTWRIDWNYSVVSTGQGCRPDAVSTVTTITTTLPRFIPATNAPPELLQRWAKYFSALARHEAQHAANGIAAASEIRTRLASAGGQASCDGLRLELNTLANAIVEQRRRADRELDQRTRHGASDGATFP